MASINVPQRGNDSVKQPGTEFILFVNAGPEATIANPSWVPFAGQRNAALEMSADELDASDKNSEGWGENLPGQKTWSISMEAVSVISAYGVQAVKQCFVSGQSIEVLRYCSDGTAVRGNASITEFSDDVPHDDIATVTVTLQGRGAPEFIENMEYPGGVQDLSATAGSGSVTLAWTAPPEATLVKVQYSTDKVFWNNANLSVAIDDTNAEVTGLVTGLQYYFRLMVEGGPKVGRSNIATATPTA
jgi:TP901-1 family phage major tail protein|nr:MAG TPA: major tail protein [Caudoviricetes sp.]DAJ57243.1 MAG TPA: major tail protein [Caudoviricetes sp.]